MPRTQYDWHEYLGDPRKKASIPKCKAVANNTIMKLNHPTLGGRMETLLDKPVERKGKPFRAHARYLKGPKTPKERRDETKTVEDFYRDLDSSWIVLCDDVKHHISDGKLKYEDGELVPGPNANHDLLVTQDNENLASSPGGNIENQVADRSAAILDMRSCYDWQRKVLTSIRDEFITQNNSGVTPREVSTEISSGT